MVFLALFVSCPYAVFAEAADYPPVNGPCRLDFPQDHASHPITASNGGTTTGNLQSEGGEPFGFQLTFFRIRTLPKRRRRGGPGKVPRGGPAGVRGPCGGIGYFLGQVLFCRKDVAGRSRACGRDLWAAGGASRAMSGESGRFEVFVNDNRAQITPGVHSLSAKAAEFSSSLSCCRKGLPFCTGIPATAGRGKPRARRAAIIRSPACRLGEAHRRGAGRGPFPARPGWTMNF